VEQEPDPEQVAGYKIVRLLGRGGMGSVYEAEDSAFGRRVALKLIGADHVASDEAVERFRQEGRLASTIAHPRCVFVIAADEHQGRPYIVMELMPGETLQTLVERAGPLPVGEAIAKVLDVVEGLQEAHLQGVIHRDVKPSNCFLGDDGRVKVGDFGLSKSLDSDAALTRTGSFVGTPLYASPEQIKRDAVDERTDVYSAAATLYYLLTGRPPFQADDAAAALAKIVSEPPTPLRSLRPELPPALEAAILRGLERDRDRRWPDLARFRQALLPFVSERLQLADQALRASAYFTDALLVFAVHTVLIGLYAVESLHPLTVAGPGSITLVGLGSKRLGFLAYFTVLEGLWGASIGKRLTGLRVSRVAGGGPPGPAPALLRAAVFYLLTSLPADVTVVLLFALLPARLAVDYLPVSYAISALGYLVMASSMRAGNGYRGLHEWASGTRVVKLTRSVRRRAPRVRKAPVRPVLDRAGAAPAGVLRSVGPYRVRGAVKWDGDRRVLLGEDPALNRAVWLVLRPKGSPPPSPARRGLGRPGRPRWLNGGEQAEHRWDAYAPQLGCPLADLAGPEGLPWADARPVLHDLADELARACADGTLPDGLAADQVWVQPDGTVQLVDPLGSAVSGAGEARTDQERALDLLRRTAALALEGGRRLGTGAGAPPTSIRAAVPEHAARMLDRLIGRPRPGDAPYGDVAALVADLEADRDKPTEVDTARRAAHLAPSATVAAPLAGALLWVTCPWRPSSPVDPMAAVVALTLLAVAWAALARGGALLGVTGLALVRADSRPAERWRCAWRAAVAWAPVAALLAASCWAAARQPPRLTLAWACWGAAAAALASYPFLALAYPARSIHDRLAGTWLVPK
jgi:hypothetical protein